MKLNLLRYELPLKYPFTISRGTLTSQPTLVVELSEDGASGFGEATANTYYGRSLDALVAALESCRSLIESTTWSHPSELWSALDPYLGDNPFAQCALDQAAYDLWGKRLGKPVYELLGWTLQTPRPLSNYTIGIAALPEMIRKLDEFSTWPVFKIKLGTDHDLELLRGLRAATSARFRVDANCGWSPQQTLEFAPQLAQLGVELIEQPLPPEQDELMTTLRRRLALPLIADESCQVPADVEHCARVGFDGINIKLVKCGGLTPALKMMGDARRMGLKVMVGCMTESSVGISAIAQLLPGLDFVDMDGAILLGQDIADGVRLVRGACDYGQTPGCGISGVDRQAALDQ